jgi:hypothetical protein
MIRTYSLGIALGLAALSWSGMAAAKIVLLAVQGPNAGKYPVGSVFADSKDFDLKKGDVLTLLDATGTRVLRGPFKGKLGSLVKAAPVSLRDVVAASEEKRWRIAAVRTLSGDTAAAVTQESRKRTPVDNLWQVELGYQGDWCMRADDDAVIIRKQPSNGEELRVIDRDALARR